MLWVVELFIVIPDWLFTVDTSDRKMLIPPSMFSINLSCLFIIYYYCKIWNKNIKFTFIVQYTYIVCFQFCLVKFHWVLNSLIWNVNFICAIRWNRQRHTVSQRFSVSSNRGNRKVAEHISKQLRIVSTPKARHNRVDRFCASETFFFQRSSFFIHHYPILWEPYGGCTLWPRHTERERINKTGRPDTLRLCSSLALDGVSVFCTRAKGSRVVCECVRSSSRRVAVKMCCVR